MTSLHRRAFSLVEITVVVGIIALLATLLLVGLRYAGASAATKSTRSTLEAATAILNEYEAASKLDNLVTGAALAPLGSLVEDGPGRASGLVSLAGAGMNRFQSAPNAAKLLAQMPVAAVSNWAAMAPTAPAAWNAGNAYLPGDRVLQGGNAYTCLEGHSVAGGWPPDSSSRYWGIETAANPILLDAWGNPIILVPGDGLVLVNDNGTPATGDDTAATTIRATSRRPFFASAGPDGVFQAPGPDANAVLDGAADNLYSFEN